MFIKDVWDGSETDTRRLSDFWVGETAFDIIYRDLKPGYEMIGGRLTRKQATTRAGNIWPEVWTSMSHKEKKLAKRA